MFKALETRFGPRARRNEPLSAHTTLRLGGPAEIWFPARSLDELVEAATLARRHAVPVFILGGGANLLIRAQGISGLVIENQAAAVQFAGTTVTAHSGAVLARLVKRCAEQGLSGLEWAVSIPGTLGGAVVNNAGAFGASIADSMIRAELLEADGSRVWRDGTWFEFEYRASRLKKAGPAKPMVLQAELALKAAPPAEINALAQTYNQRRKAGQPPGATCGSVFKNPPGDYAGRLIEAAGLKGYRQGQAQISPVHANFFINLGGATAEDLIALVETAQKEVLARFGVQLEPEVEVI